MSAPQVASFNTPPPYAPKFPLTRTPIIRGPFVKPYEKYSLKSKFLF